MIFYYTRTIKPNKYGYTVTLNIYKIKNKIPIFLTEHKFKTQFTTGERNEVFQGLVIANILPMKYKNKYSYNDVPHKIYLM